MVVAGSALDGKIGVLMVEDAQREVSKKIKANRRYERKNKLIERGEKKKGGELSGEDKIRRKDRLPLLNRHLKQYVT